MPIAVQCSGCSAKLTAPDKMAGQQTNCPKCGNLLLIGLERIRDNSAPASVVMQPASKIPVRKEPARAEKPSAPAKQPASSKPAKPTYSAKPTEPAKKKTAPPVTPAPEKRPMIGPGMRRVLVILGVVAAILYAMNELGRMMTRPRFGSGADSGQKFGHFKNADLNDPEVQKQLDEILGIEETPQPKPAASKNAASEASSQPTPPQQAARRESPWKGMFPPPNRLDPLGDSPGYAAYKLPAPYRALPYGEQDKLQLGLEYRPLPSSVTPLDRHWNGEQLGMSLASFLERYRQDEPQPGWPYLIVSDVKERQKSSYSPKSELHEQDWHFQAGVVNARIVMPEDDILYRDRLRSPEQPRYEERLYCFLDDQLCLIRYVVPSKEIRKGIYPNPTAMYCCAAGTPEEYEKLYELPRANFRRWADKDFEILHIRDVYQSGQEIILHRHVKLCEELDRRRLAAKKSTAPPELP